MHVPRAVVAAFVLVALAASPAAAHTELISSSPADGATLSSPPQRVTLTFGEDLLASGDELVARDAQGTAVALGDSRVDGAQLSAAWPQAADAGTYRVAYRAVASDGHPLEGSVTFTVTAASPTGQASTAASPTEQASPAASPAAPADTTDSSGVNLWAPLALLGALLVAGLVLWRSRAQ